MKILNAYAGIGGNRKLWGNDHQITAVEYRHDIANVYRHYFPEDQVLVADAHEHIRNMFEQYDFIWSSFPCQTHSRARRGGHASAPVYPDLGLYQEIIFLKSYAKDKLWVVENVIPHYDALIQPTQVLGRHMLWSNFYIPKIEILKGISPDKSSREDMKKFLGFDLSQFKMDSRTDQIYRNCVTPALGLHVLECAIAAHQKKQPKKGQLNFFANEQI